jgi:peptidyl-dipeptidase Dcp
MGHAILDMEWHSRDPRSIESVIAFEDEIMKDIALCSLAMEGRRPFRLATFSREDIPPDTTPINGPRCWKPMRSSFSSKKGSTTRKQRKGSKTKFWQKAGAEHPAILYRRFRGRDADPAALLRREGLEK